MNKIECIAKNKYSVKRKKLVKSICYKCGGSGVIETGNNDLPCDCPAGNKAFLMLQE